VDAVVDSGFTASSTLPAVDVAALGLERPSGGGAILADGEIRQLDIYAAEVLGAAAGGRFCPRPLSFISPAMELSSPAHGGTE
jgi:hypothetical protein